MNDFKGLTLSVLDASFILEPSFSMLESIGCQETARNLTTYEKIKPEIDPINRKEINPFIELFNFKIPIAIIAPGIEYPIMAR